jgi:DNA-binding CsgD family transcriptional regulator
MSTERTTGTPSTQGALRVQVEGRDIVVLKQSVPPPARTHLTVAEQEIAAHVLQALRNDQIASLRGRSIRTVETQLYAIYRKLGITSRAALIQLLQHGQILQHGHR